MCSDVGQAGKEVLKTGFERADDRLIAPSQTARETSRNIIRSPEVHDRTHPTEVAAGPSQGCCRRMASSQRCQGDVLGPEQSRVPLQPGGMDRVVPFLRTEAPALHIGGIRFGRGGRTQLLPRPLLITPHREVPPRVTMLCARIVGQRHDLSSSGVPGSRSVSKPEVIRQPPTSNHGDQWSNPGLWRWTLRGGDTLPGYALSSRGR